MSETVQLDVGGTIFKTSKSTLTKFNGFLKIMLESDIGLKIDESGSIFIDRSPKHFDLILNFMRDGDVVLPSCELTVKELLAEAQFYLLDELIELCSLKIEPVQAPKIKLRFIENDSQLLQILAAQQKPMLIIEYCMVGNDMSIPYNFNLYEFIEKQSHQFDIYFQRLSEDESSHKWKARIKWKPTENGYYSQFPYNLRINRGGRIIRDAVFLERLEKMIGEFDEFLKKQRNR
ncbi:BTB domain-containing protein [Caenorhabditis elegans]|uniref:BTB domain-containing protein n=1 Tax=Caenorhabditis elegans TaxID=6239 RepID=O16706_CAEEL|nr:BTB domain-containing protein [Caenorhabditis elegans]CCD68454.2 BTB domain-containing protein [Caenorhabditis elegans]